MGLRVIRLLLVLSAFFTGSADANNLPTFTERLSPSSTPILSQALNSRVQLFVEELKRETLASLEFMRDPKSSLIGDKTTWTEGFLSFSNDGMVASTNVSLDLILQMQQNTSEAHLKISTIVDELQSLEKYQLGTWEYFYWGYKKNSDGKMMIFNSEVSSLDNFHLSMALWLVSQKHPDSNTRVKAESMFTKMKLDPFVDPQTGLMRLASRLDAEGNRYWLPYLYADWGSEARSMYVLGTAMGLINQDSSYLDKVVRNLNVECVLNDSAGAIIRTWDGGTFQYLLPELLWGESRYSEPMKNTFQNLSLLAQVYKKERNLSFMPGYSASQVTEPTHSIFQSSGPVTHGYGGVVGFYPLMVKSHQLDVIAERVERSMTPHASVMLTLADPNRYVSELEALKKIKGRNGMLYMQGHGFMDAYHLQGPFVGAVVPVQLALDQGMIALTSDIILSPSRLSALALTIREAKAAPGQVTLQSQIESFYSKMNPKLIAACAN